MTWIASIPFDRADGDLRRLYEAIYSLYPPEYGTSIPALVRSDGTSESIVAVHSLIPEAMFHLMSGLAVLYRPDLPLSRRQHEMIATVVSAHNRCFY
jgi:hypothetical protein